MQSVTGAQSKANLFEMIGDENVLLSLGNRTGQTATKGKPKQVVS